MAEQPPLTLQSNIEKLIVLYKTDLESSYTTIPIYLEKLKKFYFPLLTSSDLNEEKVRIIFHYIINLENIVARQMCALKTVKLLLENSKKNCLDFLNLELMFSKRHKKQKKNNVPVVAADHLSTIVQTLGLEAELV